MNLNMHYLPSSTIIDIEVFLASDRTCLDTLEVTFPLFGEGVACLSSSDEVICNSGTSDSESSSSISPNSL